MVALSPKRIDRTLIASRFAGYCLLCKWMESALNVLAEYSDFQFIATPYLVVQSGELI